MNGLIEQSRTVNVPFRASVPNLVFRALRATTNSKSPLWMNRTFRTLSKGTLDRVASMSSQTGKSS